MTRTNRLTERDARRAFLLAAMIALLVMVFLAAACPAWATPLAADKNASVQSGLTRTIPIAAGGVHIFKGAMVCFNTEGYAVPAADTSGYKFAGFALRNVNRVSGAAAAVATVQTYGEATVSGTGFSQASVGSKVYATDDQTVSTSEGNNVLVGVISAYLTSTTVRVWFTHYQ